MNPTRTKRGGSVDAQRDTEEDQVGDGSCWLCGRPLGRKVEGHHPVPRSRGGRKTVPVHPICHRTLHALFSNAELERKGCCRAGLLAHPEMQRFLSWIANKPPDFHAPTRKPR